MALVLPVAGLLFGLLLLTASSRVGVWAWWLGIVMGALWMVLLVMLLCMLRKPRIARRGDQVLFYMRSGAPFRVPLEFVEGFLLGQGASYLRKSQPGASQVSTVVIRLAIERPTMPSATSSRRSVRGAIIT